MMRCRTEGFKNLKKWGELITKEMGILSLTSPYYSKKKSPSEYGNSDICGISRSISSYSISIC